MLRLFIILLLLATGISSRGAQLKLDRLKVGSMTFSNVTILGANATDLYFSHSQGISNVKLKYVDPELQKRFHYDPNAAASAEKQRTEEDTRYQGELAARSAQKGAGNNAGTNGAPAVENLADPLGDKSLLGKPAPLLAVERWVGEKPEAKDKATLYFFCAPWSLPCRRWVPQANGLQKKFASRLQVIGVSSDPKLEPDAFGEPLSFPVACDSKYAFASALNVTSIPCVVLVDAKGKILYTGHPAALSEGNVPSLIAKPE